MFSVCDLRFENSEGRLKEPAQEALGEEPNRQRQTTEPTRAHRPRPSQTTSPKQDFSCYHACFPQYSSKVKSYKKSRRVFVDRHRRFVGDLPASTRRLLAPSYHPLLTVTLRQAAASLRLSRDASSPLTAPRTHRILSPRKLTALLQRRVSALARTDTNNFFNRRNKNLAIAHIACATRFDNHVNQALCLIVVYHELA